MEDVPRTTKRICERARDLGFSRAQCCPAVTPAGIQHLDEWLERGYAGQMDYIANRRGAYDHPRHVLDGVRSLVMLTLDYDTQPPNEAPPGSGLISRYAWGDADYHDMIHTRLKDLVRFTQQIAPESVNRGVVDTAPLLERDFARLAGLGWVGKHTLLIDRKQGSWFFLAALLTSLELDYDAQFEADHCGTCTACLDACPTDAFPEPYVLDASRCISYLTIELREMPEEELRPGLGNWLFGCDVCQQVCPWNRSPATTDNPSLAPLPANNPVELIELFALDEQSFRRRFRRTPLWRSRRRGILRNAAIILGNQRFEPAIPTLVGALSDDEPLIRQAVAWALRQFTSPVATTAIARHRNTETNPLVRRELDSKRI